MKDFAWHGSYPKEVVRRVELDEFSSLADMFQQSCQTYTGRAAYLNAGHALSFVELETLSRQFASFLQNEWGMKKGDSFAIQMPNLLQYPVVLYGALLLGLRVVCVNPLYTAREMLHQLKDAEVQGIVILENFADKLQEILPHTQIAPERVIITKVGDLMGGVLKRSLVGLVVKHVKKMVPKYSLPQSLSFRKVLKKGDEKAYRSTPLVREDVAFLQYTGGTTGTAKGAVLTHGNILANIAQIKAWMTILKPGEETVMTPLPMYHIFSLSCNTLYTFSIGATNVLITNPRDMKSFLSDMKKYPFSFITGVNTLFNGLLNQPDFKHINLSRTRIAVAGGMALQKSVAEAWEKQTHVPILEGYGLSETSPVLTINPTNGTQVVGSIGLPVPMTELKIVDEKGKEVPTGEIGELCVKGPQVMKGYWKRDEENKAAFFGDFFRTGDMARMDEKGFFYIVDRKKEMILVSGFNVYPNEVEGVLVSHEKVLEAGVIGLPDEHSGEQVVAFVVKKDNSLTKDELSSHAKAQLTAYKCPQAFHFVDELPKTPVGKILRRAIKERALRERE